MHIYFAAHGTTTDNEQKIASGWKDVELSELGIRQAKELGDLFRNIPIDIICSSDLKRATQTAELAFGRTIPIIVDKRLRELNYGDYNGKPSEVVEPMKIPHIHVPFPNGESYDDVVVRTQEFYNELKQKYPGKVALVIGHRATQYGLDTLALGKNLGELLSTKFKWQPYWEYEL
jgi:broad specificity phosphatase PhoE